MAETATHQHIKTNREYVLVGYGKMQSEHWREWDGKVYSPIDMREVAIYHKATDPTEIWVRPREEFEDGRFEVLEDPTPISKLYATAPLSEEARYHMLAVEGDSDGGEA